MVNLSNKLVLMPSVHVRIIFDLKINDVMLGNKQTKKDPFCTYRPSNPSLTMTVLQLHYPFTYHILLSATDLYSWMNISLELIALRFNSNSSHCQH